MKTLDPHSPSSAPSQSKLALALLRDQWRGLSWRYPLIIVVLLGLGLATLLPAQLFRFFTESLQSPDRASDLLMTLVGFGAAIALVQLVSTVVGTLIQEWLRLQVESDLRRKVLGRLHQVPLSTLDGAQRGEWLTRMTGDLGQTEAFITESLPQQVRNVGVFAGAATLFFIYSGAWALLPLLTAVVVAVVNVLIQRKLAPVLRDIRSAHGGVFQILIENLEGVRTIRSHRVEPFILRRFEKKLTEITQSSLRAVRLLGALLGSNELVGQLLITGCLAGAAWGVLSGGLTLADVLVYPFFLGLFFGAAQGLAGSAYEWNRFFVEGGRLAELLFGHEQFGQVAEIARAPRQDFSEATAVELDGIEIGHGGRRLVGPLNLRVPRGELLAIMGPSGCGKSTFLEMLAGLRPAMAGKAQVLRADGEPLWTGDGILPLEPFSYVEQRPYIFEGSIRDNLTFGNPGRLSDSVIWQALERAGLYHFVRVSGGLEYFLRDRGRNLSEGERYRLALCRALLMDRPFLLLDEPFAALDQKSIEIVMATLEEHRSRAGIVVVTHTVPKGLRVDEVLNFDRAHQLRMGGKNLKDCSPESLLQAVPGWRDESGQVSEQTTTTT